MGREDIASLDYGDRTELRANVRHRPIMAHNITYRRIDHPNALAFSHTAREEFRLPFMPSKAGAAENAQTLEGMLVIWDGSHSRLDHGLGFQWRLNPWVDNEFGSIWTWAAEGNEGRWEYSAPLPVDTAWHTVEMAVNFRERLAGLSIDGRQYPVRYSMTVNAVRRSWGPETAARIQGEIVSCWPEPARLRAMHRAEFRNWSWTWRWP